MSKIKSIHIKNFKFFGDVEPIELNGLNLLLYGENGSGKSTIYNALYTLLEAASKKADGIQKYFLPLTDDNSESLLHIHAKQDDKSFIEVIDDSNKTYRLSKTDTNLCENKQFMESQRVCDFINYKAIFAFQSTRNSQPTDLHDVFERSVIPYLTCSSYRFMGRDISTLADLFKAYYNEDALKRANVKGKPVIYRNEQPYKKDYVGLEKHINKELNELVDYINEQLPDILEALGYKFNAELKYETLWHIKHDNWLDFKPFKIWLRVDEYEGKKLSAPITHPNVFLNEAKMSALAFAIRWAIFTKRPSNTAEPDALYLLLLDDLMISLDMGNREKLIDFLLSSSNDKYQILFFTHDRNLYNFVDYKINQHKQHNLWIKKEMYVGMHKKKEYPVIIDGSCDSLEKAKKYFRGRDYVVASLYLRKAIEEYIQEYLPDEYCKNADGRFVDLNTLWARFVKMTNQIPQSILEAFDQSRLLVLNPSVHYQRLSLPVYKGELVKAFHLVEELRALPLEIKILLLTKGSKLTFKHPTENYTFEFTVLQDVMRKKEINTKCRIETWQYNGIEFYNFITNSQGNPPKVKETKFKDMMKNIMRIPQLNVTEEMFYEHTSIEEISLKEVMA